MVLKNKICSCVHYQWTTSEIKITGICL